MHVDIFIPCFIDQIYPQTAFNMIKVLEKAGCIVHYNPEQTCCGQPAFNAGFWDDAKEVGEKMIKDFPIDRPVITPSASCTGMVRNYYGNLFFNSALHNPCRQLQKNLFEFSEFMTDVLKVTELGSSFSARATYLDSCSGLRECKIKTAPRKLLESVKGLTLLEMNDSETCCGFGGGFSVKFEPISVAMAEQKVENAILSGADYIISTDMSCLMHLDGYIKKQNKRIEVMHIADVLARGI